jgi:hypothetical protein
LGKLTGTRLKVKEQESLASSLFFGFVIEIP